MTEDEPSLRRVLCVDDEPRVLEGLQRTLFEHFDVTVFDSPLRALGMLAGPHEPFSVIVSDMRMPVMNGATFLSRARALVPHTTRILLTGQTDIEAAVAAINQGSVFRFLTKPCAPDVLVSAIEAGAEQHRLVTAERELLEQTLTGSIRLLSEVLTLVAPAIFERTQRIKSYVVHMTARLELAEPWRFELAAALSMLGCVGLPEPTLQRILAGRPLSSEEKRAFDDHPQSAYRLLTRIPRFGEVAEMIRLQQEATASEHVSESVRIGAALLRLAREVDQLVESGTHLTAAIAALSPRVTEADRALLDTLKTYRIAETAMVVRSVRVGQMTARMILEEDARTTAGVVVIPKGRELSPVLLERLWNFSSQGSLVEPIRVRAPA